LILLAAVRPGAAQATSSPVTGDRLAYVSGGKLHVGYPATARLVRGPGNAYHPVFSYDGQWLAFLRQEWQGYDVSSQLWLARADGSDAHPLTVMGGISTDGFQWSPSSDVLAVQPVSVEGGDLPIELVPAQGAAHELPRHLQGSFLWLPDGQTLAVAADTGSGYTRVDLVRGTSIRTYSVPGIGRYDPIKLAAWWPAADSVVYWLDRGGCFSCIADGTPLYAFDLRTGKTRRLGTGLIYRDWVAVSGDRLLAVTGTDRSAFFGKHLVLCRVAGPCRTLRAIKPGQISLDPAWATGSEDFAFVVAPAWNTSGFLSGKRYRDWLDAHVLWVASSDGSGVGPVEGVPKGAQDPQWTRDGRGLLFVKGGVLWGDFHAGAANALPIVRLVPANFVPNLQNPAFQSWYYGHMDWHELYAWY
jgi:TolB protein